MNKQIPAKIKNAKLVAKRREQIVAAGIKLFALKGFHETSLRELAKESGISHGNIYDYISTKQDIFFLIHEFINNVANKKIDKSIEGINDPLERLRRMVRAEFDLMYEWSDAILLLYQETHILKKPLMKTLLTRERARVTRFEEAIKECIEKGLLRKVNPRVAANLIKSMAETWVAKRWDLRGHSNRTEMEEVILDIISYGLRNEKGLEPPEKQVGDFQGKSVLVINAGTFLGKAISLYLLFKGASLNIQLTDEFTAEKEYPISKIEKLKQAKIYSSQNYGPMTPELFNKILKETGPIDILIHDLGIDNRSLKLGKENRLGDFLPFKGNLDCALRLAPHVQKKMSARSSGRVVYLTPLAWNINIDPIGFKVAEAAIIELAKSMSRTLANVSTTVNCIVPGYIDGIRPLREEKGSSPEAVSNIPMGFVGEISDVLEAVNYLISDNSKYLTGQVLRVTGGM